MSCQPTSLHPSSEQLALHRLTYQPLPASPAFHSRNRYRVQEQKKGTHTHTHTHKISATHHVQTMRCPRVTPCSRAAVWGRETACHWNSVPCPLANLFTLEEPSCTAPSRSSFACSYQASMMYRGVVTARTAAPVRLGQSPASSGMKGQRERERPRGGRGGGGEGGREGGNDGGRKDGLVFRLNSCRTAAKGGG